MNDETLSHANLKVKRQRARKQIHLIGQREARVLAGQLRLPFAEADVCAQASDADCEGTRLAPSAGGQVKKRTGVYSYLRWLG